MFRISRIRLKDPAGSGHTATNSSDPPRTGTYVLVNDEGGLVRFDQLVRPSEPGAATVVATPTSWTMIIPSLAAGRWQLAKFADTRRMLLYTAGIGALPLVRAFTLPAGGTVVLDLR